MIRRIAEILKKILKNVFRIKQFGNGMFAVYVCFPFLFDSRLMYALRHGSRPIQPNKIVFDNYMGKGYGCNPKYVAEKLMEKYPGRFELVWIASKQYAETGDLPDGVRVVNYASQEALREYATAKVWVSNYHKVSFAKKGLYKRKGQYFIQMWHGSLGIKKIENDVSGLTADKVWLKMAKRSSGMVDYWISNSSFESDIYRRAFWNADNILLYGHPRNDVLFRDTKGIANKVRARLKIGAKKILLYAPTFREDYRLDCYRIDYEALQQALHVRFGGEWAILVRLHPRVLKYAGRVIPELSYVFDATLYADIQELLAAADCMITDYSSCIFDFMLTKRPAFIYAADIREFDNERGFYYPLESTPFPIAADNIQLAENIEIFNEDEYASRVDAFLEEKGCMEDGHASERVVQLIVEAAGQETAG